MSTNSFPTAGPGFWYGVRLRVSKLAMRRVPRTARAAHAHTAHTGAGSQHTQGSLIFDSVQGLSEEYPREVSQCLSQLRREYGARGQDMSAKQLAEGLRNDRRRAGTTFGMATGADCPFCAAGRR